MFYFYYLYGFINDAMRDNDACIPDTQSQRERGGERGEDLQGLPNASAPNLRLSASSQVRVSIAFSCLVVRPLPEYAKNGVKHD